MRFSLRAMMLSVTVIAVLLCSARLIVLSAIGPVIPYSVLDKLEFGMTKAEIEKILGPPAATDEHAWIYERPLNPGWVEIHFYHQGRYSDFNDESAFPGFP